MNGKQTAIAMATHPLATHVAGFIALCSQSERYVSQFWQGVWSTRGNVVTTL